MAITLFLGGARSGKSRLAQQAAEGCSGPLFYLATGEARDEEMAARIARHRDDRGDRWTTIECPLDVPNAVAGISQGAILIDCMTLWLSNLMLADIDIDAATARLVETLRETRRPVFIVSNEVGMGIVPDTPLGRSFRDAAGRLNQRIAAIADDALLIVAGLSLRLEQPEEATS